MTRFATTRATLGAVLALACALVAACGRGEPAPATHTGAVPDQPRIAVLSPAIAIMLVDLGAEGAIVGRHAFDLVLREGVQVVGDQAGIDYEALLRVEPTHVVIERGAGERPPRLNDLAARRDWTVLDYPMLTLQDIRHALAALPADLALSGGAAARRDALLAAMDASWSPRSGFGAATGRALLLYSTEPLGAAGPRSFHAELLEALGGENAIAAGAPYIALDTEDVRRLDPDSVFLIIPSADPARLDDLLRPLRRAGLRAVAEGRVALIHHPHAQTPSTAMIDVAEEIAAAARQWE
ncbi:MAG: hypothetical protein EA379_10940 [Phycisphaerales bacterium]|nr:MAG: hypothetical protein EA379_10940 [Phycisphaerales bacterium]